MKVDYSRITSSPTYRRGYADGFANGKNFEKSIEQVRMLKTDNPNRIKCQYCGVIINIKRKFPNYCENCGKKFIHSKPHLY